ncbi:selenium-dependent xanthine dehydrogenase [Clostridiaceae bacterium HFYG-1003]|nr:selenium-dependent xanthine dehydrogenase [Clostridiaceae bacterium HFYG-1003]
MYRFKVNGKDVQTERDIDLMKFLREELGLASVKNGCGEGACGACSVLIDGRLMKACVQKTSKMEGKSIDTLEGFTTLEKEIYAYAFDKSGAVQCGFCTPGMLVATKALLDVNPSPDRDACAQAIRGNICRCTGYVKIIDAMLLTAELLRKGEMPPHAPLAGVGRSVHKVDGRAKALGEPVYTDDVQLPGMLYGKALRTPAPRTLIRAIDVSQAQSAPGIAAVILAEDIPGEVNCGHLVKDWPALIRVGETTRYVGDSLALVVGDTEEAVQAALKLIRVDYEELPPVTTPQAAMAQDAPLIHEKGNLLSTQKLKRGDAAAALAASKYVASYHFETPFTEHAFLEPECAVAYPTEDGVEVITSDQGVYDDRREIASLLAIEPERVRIKAAYVGGGFGGKEDMSVQHHAALIAWLLKKPVKVRLSRAESILVHPKRHPMYMDFQLGCDETGRLTGLVARIISDTGAYASLGGPVLQRACTHAAGPYNYQNVDIEGRAYYTNNVPCGAFRGFGVTQSIFALECCLNDLARQTGLDGWEIRRRNALEPGDIMPNGQIADESTAYREALEALKEDFYRYDGDENYHVGIASALKNAGLGVGVPDTGRCLAKVEHGRVSLGSSASDMGQGIHTVIKQIFCETTGLPQELVTVGKPDTYLTPNAGTTTASRQTVFTGEASRRAALEFKAALAEAGSLEQLEGRTFLGEYSFASDPMGSDKPNPVSHVAYGYAAQLVILDREGKVVKVISAHDMGRAIHPKGVEGQIEGGVVMGLGFALTEDFKTVNAVPQVKFGTLGLLRSTQIPEIVPILIEKNPQELSYGSKGIGEITVIPSAPACQNAYFKKDGRFRTTLPLEDTYYRKSK